MTEKYIITENISASIKRLLFFGIFKDMRMESKFIIHNIERIPYTAVHKGSIKWTASSILSAKNEPVKEPLRIRAYIDQTDMFPRLFFSSDNFLDEFNIFCEIRKQPIERIILEVESEKKSLFENLILKEPKVTSIDDFMKEIE